jgi:hypothetical protein
MFEGGDKDGAWWGGKAPPDEFIVQDLVLNFANLDFYY